MKLNISGSKPQAATIVKKPQDRRWIYFSLLGIINVAWIFYMTAAGQWDLFIEYWPASVTMSFGSFVAGATAEGGAAVAFPVFTKVLHVSSADARTFGLMIQSFGMTMAGVLIYVQRIKILPRVVVMVSLGGIIGQLIGTFLITIPEPYPRILFTFVATAFGVVMIISSWIIRWTPSDDLPKWDNSYRLLFVVVGVLGGIFAGQTGSGIDMLAFVVLTLAFGINEKVSTPTSVIIMGLNSVVGFFLHGAIAQDIGIVWNYWLVAVPIVIVGAPLGAYVASMVKREAIIIFLLVLITIELSTTLWLVPFSSLTQIIVTATAVFTCAFFFWVMLAYRKKYVPMGEA
ncbi:MAG: sulfite exporter TauE/SafE family protein [Anaerolineales bacterium]|nr:sulfite exporter TauE/SafE family protein [Anaerolineales bacterium]